jgi:cyclase
MRAFTGVPRLEEVADGVHAFLQPDGGWCLNNAGVIVGQSTTALVDTAATETRARRLRELAGDVAPTPPRIIVNTHSHGDHVFGNFVFPEAVVVGNERTRTEELEAGLHLTGLWPDVEWGDVVLVPPELTFTDALTLQLGDHVAELRSYGPAHSGSDTVVWLPRERVLFTGDLVLSGVTPLVLTGSLGGLRSAVAALQAFGAETIVPGHGPIGGPELLDDTERYLAWVTDLAKVGSAEGLSPLDIARETDLGEYAQWLDSERLVPNLYRACGELEGARQGAFTQIDEMFRAMVELHGGPPTCRA